MGRRTILWLRRDLRLADHPALAAAAADAEALLPLYVLDPTLLTGRFASPNRVWFLLASLAELAADLEARGSRLHVRVGRPADELQAVAREMRATDCHVSRDLTPYGRSRDRSVADRLAAVGVAFHAARGIVIHEPEEVATEAGAPFSVFTPFNRAWSRVPLRPVLPVPSRLPSPPDGLRPGSIPTAAELGVPPPTGDLALMAAPGEAAARARLARWLAPLEGRRPLDDYAATRDSLALDGTSHLSQDLRWGLLSPVEVATAALAAGGPGVERYVAELAWRDFFAHVLWHRPGVARANFQTKYDALEWRDDPEAVAAWSEGRSGYPIVDAAMRQLRATGYMHNRARMIVASFLCKDLLVDWRVGEAVFMHHLLDGDPASNNGGWQWAASTGTDAAPYFRIYNPVTQGERHDPDGVYVRRWVPELARVPLEHLHAPWTMPDALQAAAGCRIGRDYPAPVVDHSFARERALAAFGATKTNPALD